jgi:hypothetical protein
MKNLVVLLVCLPLTAKWLYMPPVPVGRLITNTESLLGHDPSDAEAYYMLGRLYSLKFALKTEVGARTSDGKVPVIGAYTREHEPRSRTNPLTPVDIESANRSLANYKRAVELAPDSALYHFGLAWMQQECSRFASQLGKHPAPDWVDLALAEYRTAYRLALGSHLRSDLSDQAGSAIIEILKPRPGSEKEIAEITRNLNELRHHPRVITPLIFSLSPNITLPDLLSNQTVTFDLDGFNSGRRWPWLRPDTCILVWDPAHTGQITSGRQLFGSVTWWMFWQNGYDALAALDDNHDGVLSGAELKGICVWRDKNSNGIADPGEVITAEEFGIVQIAVKPRNVQGTLQSDHGIRLNSGSSTFDWMPQSDPTVNPADLTAPHASDCVK